MRLNNKGFAITSILYALLILFVLLVSSYLTVLTARKNRLDKITSKIEDDYYFNNERETSINNVSNYTAPYTGKYVFGDNCYIYLSKGSILNLSEKVTECTVENGTKVTIYY